MDDCNFCPRKIIDSLRRSIPNVWWFSLKMHSTELKYVYFKFQCLWKKASSNSSKAIFMRLRPLVLILMIHYLYISKVVCVRFSSPAACFPLVCSLCELAVSSLVFLCTRKVYVVTQPICFTFAPSWWQVSGRFFFLCLSTFCFNKAPIFSLFVFRSLSYWIHVLF